MNYFIQFLTIFRIVIAPIIFILIAHFHFYGLALILFILASITDYWDGFLARKYNLQSEMGAILDPVADKILITFLIVALCIELSSIFIGMIGGIIIMREFWVSALREINARRGDASITGVTFFAKIKTSVQLITFSCYLIGLFLNNSLLIFSSNFLLFLALILTIQTGIQYTTVTFKKF